MRAKLQIDERVLFGHYVEVEVENEEKLDEAYELIGCGYEDPLEVAADLSRVEGVKIVDVCRDDGGSPDEFEVLDWYDQRD